MTSNPQAARVLSAVLGLLLIASGARADSVAQIGTSVRISRGTATLIDPQGRPGMAGMGTSTATRPGDVLTFIANFTPVPNGGLRGLGGYVTFYIPRNTEVVGARIVDSSGNTVAPHRGGLAADGAGPRGDNGFTAPLVSGSLSQVYADTGIFYATDPRTNRFPDGSATGERFLTLFNGITLSPEPTGAGQLRPILLAVDVNAHNQWDVIQSYGFGVSGAALGTDGQGHTPDMYGSAVAGPDTWYPFEARYTGSLAMPLSLSNVVASATNGPWQRIRTLGGEIGRRGAVPPMPDPGVATRIGIPALDGTGSPLGVLLHADNALESFDSATPAMPYTRAGRYAVGELVVGEEYHSEISLRVLATPLNPDGMNDVVCAEVFGGDASAEVADPPRDGKDNVWRYFLPAPSCVSLDLLFDLDVDKLVALPGERLEYTLTGKNLATTAHTNVTVSHCYTAGEVSFVSATMGGVNGTGAACPDPANQDAVTWTIPRLDPGIEFNFVARFDAVMGGRGESTIGRAIFTSTELPAPGFQTVAFTVIDEIAVPTLEMVAAPDSIPTPPGTVTYSATISNSGTGTAEVSGCRDDPCRVIVTLPSSDFTYVAGTSLVGATTVGDPAIAGNTLTFTDGLVDIPAAGSSTIHFDVDVAGSTPPGAYTSGLETWLHDISGNTVSNARGTLAEVIVGTTRSDIPGASGALTDGDTRVCGTSTEGAGVTIRIYSGGIEIGTDVTGAGGAWCVTVPTLYAGQRISATAQAAGELESPRSAELSVLAVDGGGLAACGDGIDNDGNGDTDFGMDLGCRSLLDDTEDGIPACNNSVDDDGDGLSDFPDDPGCESAMDVSETDLPECADGADNDGDGFVDFPLDPECASALDDDELTAGTVVPDAGTPDAGVDGGGGDGGVGTDGGGAVVDGGTPPDLGGVDEPGEGCGCVAAGAPGQHGSRWAWLSLVPVAFLFRRRRRR